MRSTPDEVSSTIKIRNYVTWAVVVSSMMALTPHLWKIRLACLKLSVCSGIRNRSL